MRTRILNTGWTSNNKPPEKLNKFRLHKIEIVDSWTFADTTEIERVKFYFRACDNDGWMFPGDCRFLIAMDVETGYCPDAAIETALRRQLSRYPILFIEEVVQAFRYRRYYCNI